MLGLDFISIAESRHVTVFKKAAFTDATSSFWRRATRSALRFIILFAFALLEFNGKNDSNIKGWWCGGGVGSLK